MNKVEMEYGYAPKELIEKAQKIKSLEELAEDLSKIFNQGKTDLHSNISDLDFDINKFEKQLQEARSKLTTVIESELEETTKVWDFYFKQMKSLNTLADEAVAKSKEVQGSINKLREVVMYIDVDRLKQLLDCLERIEKLSDNNKDIFKFITNQLK